MIFEGLYVLKYIARHITVTIMRVPTHMGIEGNGNYKYVKRTMPDCNLPKMPSYAPPLDAT